jgi:hypothetical protein
MRRGVLASSNIMVTAKIAENPAVARKVSITVVWVSRSAIPAAVAR